MEKIKIEPQQYNKPIFMLIHYQETKTRISDHITKFNNDLEAEWSADREAFLAKYKNRSVKQMKIKACHRNTIFHIVEMYGSFLHRNKRLNMFGATFKLNNQSIATKCKGLVSKTTAWRHVTKALEAGIFTNKLWHGSNSSYDIEWNTELLSAEYSEEYCLLLVEYYEKLFKTDRIERQTYLKLVRSKPTFSAFPKGCMVSSCNDTVTRTILEHNNNMISGLGEAEYVFIREPEQGCVEEAPRISSEEAMAAAALNVQIPEQVPAAAASGSSLTDDERKLVVHFSKMGWGLARSTIFKDRYVSEGDLQRIYNSLVLFFLHGVAYRNGLSTLYNNFCERIILAKKFQERHPEYRFMNPATYFDPNTEKGFRATKKWLEDVKLQRKKQKDYNDHNKLLASMCRKFVDDPGIVSYQQAVQTLSKLRNKAVLDIFNEFVVNAEEISPELFDKNIKAMAEVDKN